MLLYVIAHNDVDCGVRHNGSKMLVRHFGRHQDEPADNSVQLDRRKRSGQLIAGRDQDASAA
jgi:hypothetical protein